MLLLPIISNTDKRRVTPRRFRIGFPILKSCRVQPADFAETYSRTRVPRPELSMWVRSVKSSRIRLEVGINWLTSKVEAVVHPRHQPAAASHGGRVAVSVNGQYEEACDCVVGHKTCLWSLVIGRRSSVVGKDSTISGQRPKTNDVLKPIERIEIAALPPHIPHREKGGHRARAQGYSYCLSYTDLPVSFLPAAFLPDVVRVRVLPSADTTIFPWVVTVPPFLFSKVSVRSSTLT